MPANHSFRAVHFLLQVLIGSALCASGPLSARELPGIDRLGESPAAFAALKRAGSDTMHMHGQFGVPTFVWGQSPAALKSAVSPNPDTPTISDPVATAREHLRRLAPLYGLPVSRINPLPVLYSHPLKNGGAVVKFRNHIDGIEVFREEASVLLGNDGGLVAVGGFVMGGVNTGAFNVAIPDAIAVALKDWSFADGIHASIREAGQRDGHQYFTVPHEISSDDGSRV